MLRPPPQRTPVRLSKRTGRRLWLVTALDMVAVAWMIAVGNWLDQTSRLTKVITLGGKPRMLSRARQHHGPRVRLRQQHRE